MKRIYQLLAIFLFVNTITFGSNPEWMIFDVENSPAPFNSLRDITFDKDGNVVMVFSQDGFNRGGGLVFYNYNDWNVLNKDNSVIPTNKLHEVEIDKNGAIWIGTLAEDGLFKYKDNDIQVFDKTNSPIKNTIIRNIVVDSNNVKWFRNAAIPGMDLIYSYDDKNWMIYDSTYSFYKRYSEARTLFVDKLNNKWIGFQTIELYFVKYDDINWTVYDTFSFSNKYSDWLINCIEEDSTGNIWFGDFNKPILFDGNNWKIKDDYPGHHIYSIAVEQNNDVWISGDSMNVPRLIKYRQGIWSVWDSTNSAYNTRGYPVKIDKYGNKLIATIRGLYIFNENGVKGITDVVDDKKVERNKILCYPNPTSSITTIRYRIESPGIITLTLTDARGNMKILEREYKYPGDYVEDFYLRNYPQGLYNIILQQGAKVYSEKIILMK